MDLLSRQCCLRASASRACAARSRSSSLSIPSNTAVRLGRERELWEELECDCRALGGVRSSPSMGADRGGVRGAIGNWSRATRSSVEAG